MNANDQFFARDAKWIRAAVAPLPASRKVYVAGLARRTSACRCARSRRRDTPASFGAETNPPFAVYDTLGSVHRSGGAHRHPRGACRRCARAWIAERGDTEELRRPRPPSTAARGSPIRALARLRFDLHRKPLRAQAGRQRHADALRAARHRHAGDGVRRHPREPARDEVARAAEACAPASGPELRRGDPRRSSRRSSCATRWRAAARSSRPTSTTRRSSR